MTGLATLCTEWPTVASATHHTAWYVLFAGQQIYKTYLPLAQVVLPLPGFHVDLEAPATDAGRKNTMLMGRLHQEL